MESDVAVDETMSRLALAQETGRPVSVIALLAEELRAEYPECFISDESGMHLDPNACQLIKDHLPPEEGLIPLSRVCEWLDVDMGKATTTARRLSAAGSGHENGLVTRREEGASACSLFVREEFAPMVRESIELSKERAIHRQRSREITEQFSDFADEMLEGETINAQEFRKLFEILGPDSGMDLIFQYRPDFKDAPVDKVTSFLTDYIGSIIVNKGKLELDNLSLVAEHLSNPTLKKCLIEVIKKHCHQYYQLTKRTDQHLDDLSIISDHLEHLREKITTLKNDDLNEVLEAVDDYYTYLFVAMDKPDCFVDSITGDRPFPDLNQRINVGELLYEQDWLGVEQKRTLLIADDPGMGKSASAIMAKEKVGAKCAVIVAPGSMADTWQTYLSDYFKEDQQPRVLFADSPKKLMDVSPDDYDYIILTHGRLKPSYTSLLREIGFDMLIVDEAHEFKNIQDGAFASELLGLADYISENPDSYTLMLTATPAPNKVVDIAMMLRVLYPNRFLNDDGTAMDNSELALRIIRGDYIDLRNLLVPRMQRKLIAESIKMPELVETTHRLELSDKMKELYEILLDEDELTSSEKIQKIRQLLNNPAALEATPGIESVKAVAVGKHLRARFEEEDKILMFVNDYVNNIITGEHTIFEAMDLPEEVQVYTITGDTPKEQRRQATEIFQNNSGKVLLVVSGGTAGLGIDLSAAERVVFYNEPWNNSLRRQQIGRAYRPGRKKELYIDTFYFPNTLEEGMRIYAEAKDLAIQKLLHGVQLSQLEQEALIRDEKQTSDESAYDINPELAAYYYSSWQRMLKMFGHVKEMGEKDFGQKFLPDHGREYAKTYGELTNRSYQANTARLNGTLIAEQLEKQKKKPAEVRILDIASGPEMLKRHIPEEYRDSVVSLDMNMHHFEQPGTNRIGGQMLSLPIRDGSIDHVNMALALHYTKQRVKDGLHERTQALAEVHRVLKAGGQATITMIWSMDFEDTTKLADSLKQLGFKIVTANSGEVESGPHFKARVLTIEKLPDTPHRFNFRHASNYQLQTISAGFKLKKTEANLRDSKKIVDEFRIKKQRHVKARLTATDQEILEEETRILKTMHDLRKVYKTVKNIPAEEIIMNGFARVYNGKKHLLFAKLQSAIGAVIFR
jgi:superfamily II DNA or RNA helicase